MFKFAIVVAALAVSASLAVSIPQQSGGPQQERSAAATNSVTYKRQKPDNKPAVLYAEANVEGGGGGGGGLMEGGLSGLLEIIAAPKKLLGIAFDFVVAQLKAMTLKRVLKIALVGALVTVLGAVAAVSVAGLVSLVSGLCAVMPYVQMFMGGGGGGAGIIGAIMGGNGGNGGGEISDEHMDTITEFVLGAMDKYEKHGKA